MGKILLKDYVVRVITITDFKIPKPPTSEGDDGNGVFSCIYRGKHIPEIAILYDRNRVCLKIFRGEFKPLHEFWWGFDDPQRGSLLTEATHIQNIFAHHRLAPRVYGLMEVHLGKKKYWAQVVEDVGHYDSFEMIEHQPLFFREKIIPLAEKNQITVFDDGREPNLVNGKYVDFQGFHLSDKYLDSLRLKIKGVAAVGRWGPWQNYHPFLGLSGGRDNAHREERLNLDDIDFLNKLVLDIGCSEGYFCHYAERHGARRVVGIDLPGVVENMWELASYLGCYNIDFVGMDLMKENPKEKFDIVFFLSMGIHIGLPDWVIDRTNNLLVYEGNGKHTDEPQIDKISREMDIVYANKTEDLFERRVVWGKKRPKK